MRVVVVIVLLGLTVPVAAEEPGWIRVTTENKVLLFRPDGSERTEVPVPGPSRGQPSPDGKHILRVDPAGEGSVHVTAGDGTGDRKIPQDGVPAGSASWRPDGRQIVFLARRGDHWQVHTADADGGNVQQLTTAPHGTWAPKFGPDGRLTYLVYHERKTKLQPADLVIADERQTTAIVKNTFVTSYAWSPDGKTIVYGKPGALVFQDLATGPTREVAFPNIDKGLRSHGAWNLSWSPDGRAVACTITFLGGRMAGGPPILGDDQLFVIRRDGRTTWFHHGGTYARIEWVNAH